MAGYPYVGQVTDPNAQKSLKAAFDLIVALRSELDALTATALTTASPVSARGERLIDVAAPAANSDAANVAYVKTYVAAQLESFGGGYSGVVVDPAGALAGEGGEETPLAVRVDGVTVVVNGANELEATSSGGSPGGSNKQVQFNDSSAFGGKAGFEFDKATDILSILGLLDLTAGQLKFPATQNPSSNANILDDFKRGNFTPVLGGAGGTSGQTYDVQVGRYFKFGKLVVAFGYVDLSAKGTITGDVQIQGFPYTSENTANLFTGGLITYFGALATAVSSITLSMNPNATAAQLYAVAAVTGGTSVAAMTAADIGNNTQIGFAIMYGATA